MYALDLPDPFPGEYVVVLRVHVHRVGFCVECTIPISFFFVCVFVLVAGGTVILR